MIPLNIKTKGVEQLHFETSCKELSRKLLFSSKSKKSTGGFLCLSHMMVNLLMQVSLGSLVQTRQQARVGVRGQNTTPGTGGIGVRGDSDAVGVWGEGKTWHGVAGVSHSTTGGAGVSGLSDVGSGIIAAQARIWHVIFGTSQSTTWRCRPVG